MFDYESLQGLEGFREVRLEPLPMLEENEQPLFRTAYSVTQTRRYCEGNHIEGVVLFVPNQETQNFRQIHFYQGHDVSDGRRVEKPRVQLVASAKAKVAPGFARAFSSFSSGRVMTRSVLMLLLVFVMVACGGNDPTPQPTPNPEPIPSTPEPEPNPNPVPTPNPEPDPEPEPTPEPETTPPSIVSVRLESARGRLTLSPGQAQRGADKDTNIVITFSETMNEAVTEAAFQSDNAGLSDVTFVWDEASTVLTIDPRASLEYTAPRKQYNFSLEETASDLAGNPLAGESSFIFFTLQRTTKIMPAVLSLEGSLRRNNKVTSNITKDSKLFVGDIESDANPDLFTDRSFLTFDLSPLLLSVKNEDVLSARLSVSEIGLKGTPFNELGALQLEHVVYGSSLEASDFDAEVLSLIMSFVATNNVAGTFSTLDSESLLAAVREDRELTERGKRSQFRLRFQFDGSGDDRIDAIQFASSDNAETSRLPTLEVTFLEP